MEKRSRPDRMRLSPARGWFVPAFSVLMQVRISPMQDHCRQGLFVHLERMDGVTMLVLMLVVMLLVVMLLLLLLMTLAIDR